MRVLAVFAAIAVVAVVLAFAVLRGTSGADFPAAVPVGPRALPSGDVYRSPVDEPATLNPFTMQSAMVARMVLPYTHDALIDRDPVSGAMRAAAAASWDVAPDGLTVTYRLRDDLVFADGAPVTQADLEFTLTTCRDPRLEAVASEMAFALAELAAATAPDARTLVLQLREPRAAPEFALGTAVRILQRAYFAAATGAEPGTDAFFAKLPQVTHCGPGTGPYAEQEFVLGTEGWVAGSHLNLVRNPHCWRLAAQPRAWNLAGMQLRFILDPSAVLSAARSGVVDWIVSQSATDLGELQRTDPVFRDEFVRYSYDPAHVGHYLIVWNCARAPFDRTEVRRALGLLIDRAAIAREVFDGAATVARGWFKPGMPEYPPEALTPQFAPEAARTLLTDAGFGPGGTPLQVHLMCVTVVPAMRRIAELIRKPFADAGVELVIESVDGATLGARKRTHDFDALLWLQGHEPVIDPYDFFAAEWNDMGYRDPELEDVLLRARSARDPAARIAAYGRFHELLAARQPVSLLVHPRVDVLLHRRFKDASPGPLGLFPERWWVEPTEQRVR